MKDETNLISYRGPSKKLATLFQILKLNGKCEFYAGITLFRSFWKKITNIDVMFLSVHPILKMKMNGRAVIKR